MSTLSRVRRRRTADRIFFLTVNLRRSLTALTGVEFALIVQTFHQSRDRLHQSLRQEKRSSCLPSCFTK
jgi:hypothetical protein